MPHVGKQVEFFHRTGDGIGNELAHHVRRVHAVPRITLAVIHIFVDAPEGRDAFQHDADPAAPFVFDF